MSKKKAGSTSVAVENGKNTIARGDDFHVYNEGLDCEYLHLKDAVAIELVAWEGSQPRITIVLQQGKLREIALALLAAEKKQTSQSDKGKKDKSPKMKKAKKEKASAAYDASEWP